MIAVVEVIGSFVLDFNKGNIKVCCCMIVQYVFVGFYSGVVIGIDYAVENIIGFFIKFGDGGVDIFFFYCFNKC